MAGIAARDLSAMRGLFDRYAPLMLAISRRVLRDEHEAEDVVNEVFWEIWDRPERFVPERGAPRTYLLLVTRSRAIDRLRSRRSGTQGKTTSAPLPDPASPQPGPSAEAELTEMRRVVREVLSQLPDAQRDAVSKSFLDGLTHTQIAEQTSEPLGTIKGRIRQGLIRLREELRKRRGEEWS